MVVLAYHKVDEKFELGLTNVKPAQFSRQIDSFGRHGIAIADSVDEDRNGAGNVYLTFDDGYDCFYRNVVPILAAIGAKATVFVISDFIGKRNSWDLRLSFTRFIHMNAVQLREVAKLGFEIGSHSRSHRDLSRLSPESSWNELTSSKKEIEDIIGGEVASFSFPYGRYNHDVVKQAGDAGYKNLFGLGSAAADGVIGRIPVYRIDGTAAVERKAAMNRLEVFKCDLIHSFSNVSALISVSNKAGGQNTCSERT